MDFFGLDIGHQDIKIVKLKNLGKGTFLLENAVQVSTPASGLQSESDVDINKLAEILKTSLHDNNISEKHVVASLPESEVFTRVINFPVMKPSEIQAAVRWEIEQNIPLEINEVNYSYQVVDNKTDGTIDVMVIAAPKRTIQKIEKILSAAELIPIALETDLVAATRAIVHSPASVMIIIMGSKTAEIGIVKNQNLIFTRTITTGGDTLTRSLTSSLQLELGQAEAYKKTYGLTENQLEGKIANALQPIIDILIRELRRTINFYQSQADGNNITSIIISGGSANLPGLTSKLSQDLSLEVQLANPIQKVDTRNLKIDLNSEQIQSYVVAFGLAMREN